MYDWTVYFDSTLTDFSQHSEARIFRFYKNKENKVVIMYKTNILENNWRGFQTELSSKHYEIQICTFFQQFSPQLLVPESLNQIVVDNFATSASLQTYYSSTNQSFWIGLQCNSVAYLESISFFPTEGIYFLYF
jgi:hypothetical protein